MLYLFMFWHVLCLFRYVFHMKGGQPQANICKNWPQVTSEFLVPPCCNWFFKATELTRTSPSQFSCGDEHWSHPRVEWANFLVLQCQNNSSEYSADTCSLQMPWGLLMKIQLAKTSKRLFCFAAIIYNLGEDTCNLHWVDQSLNQSLLSKAESQPHSLYASQDELITQ